MSQDSKDSAPLLLEPNKLASYLASKICHDLVSPVGAAASAIDFREDCTTPEMLAEAEDLLQSSTNKALARLQFLRYAFGTMGLSNGMAEMHEARAIAEGYIGTHKGEIDWNIEAQGLSFAQVRVMMNLIMLGMACLSRQGVLKVTITEENEKISMVVHASGMRAKLSPSIRMALNHEEPEDGWDPMTIQPYFTTMIVSELGGSFSFEVGEEQVQFTVTGL